VKTILARGFDQRADLGARLAELGTNVYAADARFVRAADTLFTPVEPQS
jgi:hypothetical protein